MPFDAPDALVEFADQYAVPKYRRVIVGHRLAQRGQTGGKAVELSVMAGNGMGNLCQQVKKTAAISGPLALCINRSRKAIGAKPLRQLGYAVKGRARGGSQVFLAVRFAQQRRDRGKRPDVAIQSRFRKPRSKDDPYPGPALPGAPRQLAPIDAARHNYVGQQKVDALLLH